MKLTIQLCVLLSFTFTGLAFADHPTISLERGSPGPITTISAIPLPQGAFTATVQGQFIFFDEISDDDLERFSFLGEDVHSTASVYTASVNGAYGMTDNHFFGVSLPYVWRQGLRAAAHSHEDEHAEEAEHHEHEHGEEEEAGTGSVERLGDLDGLGDLTLYGQWRFLGQGESALHAALIYGLRVPTGRTDARAAGGELFEAEHQPGSGSLDPLAGLALTRQFGRLSVDASLLYFFVNQGTQSTNLGDILTYNLGFSYRMFEGAACACEDHEHVHNPEPALAHSHGTAPTWDLILEFNGDWRDQQTIRGEVGENTGGNIIYLSAGTRLTWQSGWAATLSAGTPIVEDLNGVQSAPEARVLFGISKAF